MRSKVHKDLLFRALCDLEKEVASRRSAKERKLGESEAERDVLHAARGGGCDMLLAGYALKGTKGGFRPSFLF